jgi:anti-sigma regulatory factor (Ser/Thr protein kinase)
MVHQARKVVQTVARTAGEVTRARHVVGAWLESWGLGPYRTALELVASELLSNAVRHGRGPVELCLSTSDTTVRIEVCDEGGGTPYLRPTERTGRSIGGWGLRLVDQLVDAWGTEVRNGRTCVWIEHTYRRLFNNPRPTT